MNEVGKMYKTIFGEFAPNCSLCAKLVDCEIINNTHNCNKFECDYKRLFTAEKQLELYKYLCKPFLITTRYYFNEFSITAENTFEWKTMTEVSVTGKTYEECIAKLVNNLWQDLIDTERTQIKEILESEVRE